MKDQIEKTYNVGYPYFIYRNPLINGVGNNVFYTLSKIKDDGDVTLMFHYHGKFNHPHMIKSYVRFIEDFLSLQLVYPTQSC